MFTPVNPLFYDSASQPVPNIKSSVDPVTMATGTKSPKFDGSRSGRLELAASVEFVRRAVYFEHICITGPNSDRRRLGTGTILYTDWPEDLLAVVSNDKWFLNDPVQAALLKKRSAVSPAEIIESTADLEKANELLRIMTGFGVPVPLAVPIFHLQRLCGAVAFSRHKPFHPDESYYLSLVAPAFHRDFARELRAGLDGRAQLTLREIECLRHASTGMTSEEIAEVMPLAAATVTAQLRSAAAKLGAANRVSAIAEAIRRGVIE